MIAGTVVHEDYDVTTSYPRYKIGESIIVTVVLWGLSIYWIVLWRSN